MYILNKDQPLNKLYTNVCAQKHHKQIKKWNPKKLFKAHRKTKATKQKQTKTKQAKMK